MKNHWLVLTGLYGTFLLWHQRLIARPLTRQEVDTVLDAHGDDGSVSQEDALALREFLAADDGKPFYMLNLMQYREQTLYPDGLYPEVRTGRQADALYGQVVLRELLKRGAYPLFLGKKLRNVISAGPGTDFFETVGIIRYRSRRDMLNMIASPAFQAAKVHKWASLERTVVVPTRKLILIEPGWLAPALLLALGTAIGALRRNHD